MMNLINAVPNDKEAKKLWMDYFATIKISDFFIISNHSDDLTVVESDAKEEFLFFHNYGIDFKTLIRSLNEKR